MKMPEKAPVWHELLGEIFKSNLQDVPGLSQLIEKANNTTYPYWDKFKHLNFPRIIAPEQAWACLKLSRMNRQAIPLTDKKGRPFSYWLPKGVMGGLHLIDRNSAGQILVEGEGHIDPSLRKQYVISSLMEEAITSSQIEGAATSRLVAREILRTKRKPQDTSEQMIVNNYRAMEHIKKVSDKPLTMPMLTELHEILTVDTLDNHIAAGRFRKEGEEIHVQDEADNVVLHIPPHARELNARIQAMCDFANAEDSRGDFVHPVIKAIVLHFWIGYVHPFVDGNGRTARALFYWYMLKKGYWLFEFISISQAIKRALQQYKRAYLYTEIDENDLTYFIGFNLRIINQSLDDARAYIARKQQEVRQSIGMLKKYSGINIRQRAYLGGLLKDSGLAQTIRGYKNSYGITYQTARVDLLDLEKRGLLSRLKSGREFVFIPAKNFRKKLAPA